MRFALLLTAALADGLLLHGLQPYTQSRCEQASIRCQLTDDTNTTPLKKDIDVSEAATTLNEILQSEATATAQPNTARLFAVEHQFDREQTSAEIEYAGQLHTLGKGALHTAGFCRVGYLPGYGASKVFCIWECKDELPRETFDDIRKALDPGPLGDVQVIYQVDTELPGASVPASAFKKDAWTTPKPPGPFAPSTGSFFWVRHVFRPGGAASFWAAMEAEPAGFASPYPDRTYNHYLLPTGTTDDDALFSVWETREPMHAEEFAGFIDGPHSPARAAWFESSEVQQVAPNASPLPSVFQRRGFMNSAAMPLMDAAMPSMKKSKSWLSAPAWLESDW
jgi:hypothetical protein